MCEWKEDNSHMVIVELPHHMEQYKQNRISAGLTGKIVVDKCIVDDIRKLWDKGIDTHGCCCGHFGQFPRMVNVADKDIQAMLDMGYVQNHEDPERKDTFKLKSA